jgi:predicted Fe-Mo cluster-binding NifX family protein
MKICIPSTDDKGLDSTVFDHFGRAPFFTLVEVESGDLEVMSNPDCHSGDPGHHGQHSCHHTGHLKGRGVDTVVSSGMGRGAFAGLNKAGIEVLIAGPGTVRDVVEAVKSGKAHPLDMDKTCGGGRGLGHGDGHVHGHARGHGDGCGNHHSHGHGHD